MKPFCLAKWEASQMEKPFEMGHTILRIMLAVSLYMQAPCQCDDCKRMIAEVERQGGR